MLLLAAIFALGGCAGAPELRVDLVRPAPGLDWRRCFEDPDLVALVEVALAANLDVRLAVQRLAAAEGVFNAAGGALQPTASGTVDVGVRRFGLYTMDGAGNLGVPIRRGQEIPRDLPDYRVGVQARWEIDLWGRLASLRDAAYHRMLASSEALALARTGVIGSVASLYYGLLAKDAEAAILDDTIALQRSSLAVVELQRQVGAANELTRQQFLAELSALEAERARIAIDVAALEAAINGLCGRGPQPVERGVVPLAASTVPVVATGVDPMALRNRPDVRQAELLLAAAGAEVDAAEAAFLPRLSLDGFLGLQAFRPDLVADGRSYTYGLVGGVAAPLWNRAALDAELVGATAARKEAVFVYEQTVVEATLEVDNLLATLRQLDVALRAHEQQAVTTERSIAVASDLFRAGAASYLEMLGVQQASLRARLGLVEVQRDRLLGAVGLFRALGGGAELSETSQPGA